jgi:hypothetical protein
VRVAPVPAMDAAAPQAEWAHPRLVSSARCKANRPTLAPLRSVTRKSVWALCEKRSAKAVAADGQSKKALPGSGTQAADTAERHVVNEVVVAHVCAHVHACV